MNTVMHTETYGTYAKLLQKPGVIDEKDVVRLRREVFRDGIVSLAEADAVIALNDAATQSCEEWNIFFIEAMTDYMVNQAEPRGYVSVENAKWLMTSVSKDGVVQTATELELLVRILAKARSCPQTLIQFVMLQVSVAVVEGMGPLAHGAILTKGVIGQAEVEMLRTILFAAGGENSLSISKQEAEVLVQLNDKTNDAENHPSWQGLFVRATANYLMSACGSKPPSRQEALAREEWLKDTKIDMVGMLGEMASGFTNLFSAGFFDDIFTSSHTQMEREWKKRNDALAKANHQAEAIDAAEAQWLIDRINRNGVIDDNEKALLAFIDKESPSIDPAVKALIEKVA